MAARSTTAAAAPAERKILFRPHLGVNWLTLRLRPTSGGKYIDYTPNAGVAVGARAGYGPLVASVATSVATLEDPDTHGKSRFLDLQLASAFRFGGYEVVGAVFLQQYRGFFIDNHEELGTSGDPAPPVFPDMRARALGATLTFFFDPNFSYDDAFIEYRRRRVSEGSLALRLSVGHGLLDSGGPTLVPDSEQGRFADLARFSGLESAYGSVAFGGAYHWVSQGGMFGALAGLAGLNLAAQTATFAGEDQVNFAVGPTFVAHLVGGYAGDVFHTGLLVAVDHEYSPVGDALIAFIRGSLIVFLGARF